MNRFWTRYFVYLVFYCLVGYANAVDLEDTYQSSISYNADYLTAIAKNQAGQEYQVQGRSQLLPQITGTAGVAENYINTSGLAIYYHQPTAAANLSQVVFDFSKFSNFTKSKYATQLADLQLINAKQQLIVNVAQAYFDVLYANDVVNAIRLTKNALEKQMAQAKKSFDVGTVTIADVNDAKSGYDTASAQEIGAINDLINKKNIFRNLTGLNPDLIQPVIDNMALAYPIPNSVEEWANMAKMNNLNIKIANEQLSMAYEDINIAKSGHLPTLNLMGGYNYQGPTGIDATSADQQVVNQSANTPGSLLSSYTAAQVGLNLNIPIYSGGGVSSQVRQAIGNYEAAKNQLLSIERQTDQNIRNAFWQVQNGVSLVNAQTQALKSAKVKLDSDRLGYQVGIRNSVDLVNSEKNYATVIQNYNYARYQYLMYRLQLKYLAGDIDNNFLKIITVPKTS